jgi:hypothetical protein
MISLGLTINFPVGLLAGYSLSKIVRYVLPLTSEAGARRPVIMGINYSDSSTKL